MAESVIKGEKVHHNFLHSELQPHRNHSVSDEIDLILMSRVIWQGKKILICVTVLFSVVGLCLSLMLPNVYQPQALIVSSHKENNGIQGALGGQLSSLASFAGANFLQDGGDQAKALAILTSRRFLEQFIERHDLLIPLMATIWRPISRRFEIDNGIYDVSSQSWVDNRSKGGSQRPSNWEAVNLFRGHLTVSEEKKTGIITIAFEWHDPVQASKWLNELISDLNAELRAHDRKEAQRAIKYLREQLDKTHLVDMQQVFYQLIESQMKTLMLTDAKADYAFQVIDPAVVPEIKVKPSRSMICILAAMLGIIVGLTIVAARELYTHNARPEFNK